MGSSARSPFAFVFASCAIVVCAACVGDEPEGSRPVDPPGTPDASSSSGGDATPGTDSGSPDDDAGGGNDAQGPRFCEAHPTATFCADFDAVVSVTDGWGAPLTKGGGMLEPLTSPVRGLRAVIPAVTAVSPADGTASAILSTPSLTLGPNRRVTVELSMRASDVTLDADATYRQLRYFYIGVEGGNVGLYRRNSGWYLAAVRTNGGGATGYESPPLTKIPKPDAFSKIKLDVVFSPTSGSARIEVDGTQADYYAGPTLGDAQADPPATSIVVIGATQSKGATPSVEAAYDDVLVNVLP